MMKTHSLLFNPEMGQAVHDGRKTQTRRIIKDQDIIDLVENLKGSTGLAACYLPMKVGDRIIAKEHHWTLGHWITTDDLTKIGRPKRKFVRAELWPVRFQKPQKVLISTIDIKVGWYKRNSLFMPLVDARTTLLITNVRVQRLQDIKEMDPIYEGIEQLQRPNWHHNRRWKDYSGQHEYLDDHRDSFRTLINSINGPDTWAENPWVVAYSFEKITTPNSGSNGENYET